jgi:beta-phosphoglucomutase family hydrolase
MSRSSNAGRSEDKQPVSVESLGAQWWDALDAADVALRAAAASLSARELAERAVRLSAEREATVRELEAYARDAPTAMSFSHLLTFRANPRRLLGLPAPITACIFNLDGVLIDSAPLHAAAWRETFDEFITTRTDRTRGRFAPFNAVAPFDVRTDYPTHMHGKPRLDGVCAFLASRGISLPDGRPDDPPGGETVYGLANRKNQALQRVLDEQHVHALDGARRYLETARAAGVRRAVVSASAHTPTILEQAGLSALVEESVDGRTMLVEHLHGKPAPDTLLTACRRLGVEPERAALFETTVAGVAAGRAAGAGFIVGVDHERHHPILEVEGADLVVAGVADLLQRSLAA